ncbi:MAG: zinc ribbon domain-containing protein [Anaerolineae bacterium]|nr:zinc ribbon domain-containing protein [Anaerolineae bacterium]
MAGFLGKLKSGADKAAFEADRLVRVNQAQSALRAIQRELEAEVAALGQQAVELYDAGALTQPELLALAPKIDSVRERIAAQEAEVERIRQEKPPEAAPAPEKSATVAPAAPEPPPPAPAPVPQGHVCPKCQTPLRPDVRFCPECGFRVADM